MDLPNKILLARDTSPHHCLVQLTRLWCFACSHKRFSLAVKKSEHHLIYLWILTCITPIGVFLLVQTFSYLFSRKVAFSAVTFSSGSVWEVQGGLADSIYATLCRNEAILLYHPLFVLKIASKSHPIEDFSLTRPSCWISKHMLHVRSTFPFLKGNAFREVSWICLQREAVRY